MKYLAVLLFLFATSFNAQAGERIMCVNSNGTNIYMSPHKILEEIQTSTKPFCNRVMRIADACAPGIFYQASQIYGAAEIVCENHLKRNLDQLTNGKKVKDIERHKEEMLAQCAKNFPPSADSPTEVRLMNQVCRLSAFNWLVDLTTTAN